MTRVLVAVSLLLTVTGCGGTDWEDSWRDARGEVVPESVVSTVRGAEHCGWESAFFLWLGWPLGTAAKTSASAREYIRDPERRLPAKQVLVPLDLDASLPGDARYTGYHLDDAQLWVSAREAREAVYIVRGEKIERWPRSRSLIACA